MQFGLLALSAALLGFVSAQTTQGALPVCANGCVTSLLPASCNGNPTCICSDTNFISNISCCIFNACSTSDQQAALNYAKTLCTPAGVTLPAQASCSNSTSTSTNSTSSTTSRASSVSSSASAAASSATSRAAAGERTAAQGLGLVGAIVGAVALL